MHIFELNRHHRMMMDMLNPPCESLWNRRLPSSRLFHRRLVANVEGDEPATRMGIWGFRAGSITRGYATVAARAP